MADDVEIKFGADISKLNQDLDVVTSKTVGYSKSLMAAMAQADATASPHLENIQEKMEGVNFKTAGTTREFLVLGREVMTGNFSRIPGSLIVLANRMGGLQAIMSGVTLATVGWGAAIGALVVGVYEWASASERAAETQNTIKGAMELSNQSLSYSDEAVQDYIYQLRILANLSSEEADKIAVMFARSGALSIEQQAQAVKQLGDYMSGTGKTAEEAAKDLIKFYSEPDKFAHELAKTIKNILTPVQLDQIDLMKKNGESAKNMADVLLRDIGPKLDEFRAKHLTTFQKQLEGLRDQWVDFFSGRANPGVIFEAFDSSQKQARSANPPLPSGPEVDAQNRQNALNEAELQGLDVLKTIHIEHEKINELTEKRVKLEKGLNAATDNEDEAQALKLRQGILDIDDQIAKEKKRMNAEATAEARKAAQEQIEIEREKATTIRELSQIEFQTKKDQLRAEVDSKLLTKQQEISSLKDLAAQEYSIDTQAYQDELKNDNLKLSQKQRIDDEIKILHAKHVQEMASLDESLAQANAEDAKKIQEQYAKAFNVIDNDMDQMLTGVLQGTQTWQQAMARLFGNLALSFIEAVLKMELRWAAFKAASAFGFSDAAKGIGNPFASNASGGQTSLMASLLTALGINTAAQTAHTTATVANTGATITLSSDQIAQLVPNTAETLTNTLAINANTAAQGTSSGGSILGGLFSGFLGFFDEGTNYVPQTGLAVIHKGEMVIPAAHSDTIRAGGSLGGGSTVVNVAFNVSAVDGQSAATFLRGQADTIAQIVSTHIRNSNLQLANTMRGA